MITIDGSLGEPPGQILRSSLALAAITQRPLRIVNIRARRSNPGLGAQHVTCAIAAAQLGGGGRLEGAFEGNKELVLTFDNTAAPAATAAAETNNSDDAGEGISKQARNLEFSFDIASAGSTMLVLQTVLPIALFRNLFAPQSHAADAPAAVRILGGTHNGLSPSSDFIAEVFLPALERYLPGAAAAMKVERFGAYPAGGGRVLLQVKPYSIQPATQQQKKANSRINNNDDDDDDDEKEDGKQQPQQPGVHRESVCELEGRKLKTWTVTLAHTRTAEQGSRNTLGAAAIPDTLAQIQAKLLPFSCAESATTSAAATAPQQQGGGGSKRTKAKQAQEQKEQQQQQVEQETTAAVKKCFNLPTPEFRAQEFNSFGRGWAIVQRLTFEKPLAPPMTMVLTSIEKQLPHMISDAATQIADFFAASSSNYETIFVDEYLCDQLLLPLALYSHCLMKRRGERRCFVFKATCLSLHAATNMFVVEHWLGRDIFKVTTLGETTAAAAVVDYRAIATSPDPAAALPRGPVLVEIMAN